MRKETAFLGQAANATDRNSADGELSVCLNAVPEDGGLRPVLRGCIVMEMKAGERVLCVHETATYKHYIIYESGDTLSWVDAGDKEETRHEFGAVGSLPRVTVLGNTLVFVDDGGISYFLWSDGKYKDLGGHLPEIGVSFGLVGEISSHTDNCTYTYKVDGDAQTGHYYCEDEEAGKTYVAGQANKFIADYATNKGRFMFPFFVRFAYRLFDGSLTMHSAPVLMIPNAGFVPMVKVAKERKEDGSKRWLDIETSAVTAKLDMCVLSGLKKLEEWSDVVSGVDIFITEGIRYYNQGGTFSPCFYRLEDSTLAKWADQSLHYGVYKQPSLVEWVEDGETYDEKKSIYGRHISHELTGALYSPLPQKTDDVVENDIKTASSFFLLKSIDLADLVETGENTRKEVEVADDYLQSLLNREVMTDDYDSHDTLTPTGAVAYNSRVNMYGIEKSIYKGAAAQCLFPYTDACPHYNGGPETPLNGPENYNDPCRVTVYVWIKPDGGEEKVVKYAQWTQAGWYTPLVWFYHPSSYAKKVMILEEMLDKNGTVQCFRSRTENLKRHSFLNGSYFFDGLHGRLDGWADESRNRRDSRTPEEEGKTIANSVEVSLPNKLYTSEVNNPWFFPVTNINTLGTGRITTVVSAAKALSQGQFGQFPLYALCSDGVWALETSSTGGFSAKQPFARDVCSGADAVLQLDSSVLFATDRGLMHVSGSGTECVSDAVNNRDWIYVSDYPGAAGVLPSKKDLWIAPFRDYLAGCNMVYDYAHQRVTLYNTKYAYAYVLSLGTRLWGMCENIYTWDVNSYPNALVQTTDNMLYDISVDDDINDSASVFLLTRPLKYGNADSHKTVTEVALRGDYNVGIYDSDPYTGMALYGSNDMQHWRLVWSGQGRFLRGLRGSPYKYFRLLVRAEVTARETLTGFSSEVEERLTNRMR